jgi:hypothetical protein
MVATYHLHSDELDRKFLSAVKSIFKNRDIHITIEEYDDTEYLMKSGRNKEELLDRLQYIAEGREMVRVSIEELDKML